MNPQFALKLLLLASLFMAFGERGWAQAPSSDGAAIFRSKCAGCHTSGRENVPTPDQLALRPQFAIVQALDSGKMRIQGDALSAVERRAVAAYLSKIDAKLTDSSQNNKCQSIPSMAPTDLVGWNGWGLDSANTRYQTKTSITVDSVRKLRLKWAFGLQNTDTSYAQPTVIGGRLFFGSADGYVYSLDADTGCTIWTFKSEEFVRSSVSVGLVNGRILAFFGDVGANIYGLDARTGAQV